MGNCYNYTPIPPAEASCIIAHLFVELALPCSCCKREDGVIVIQGKTYDGSSARVTIKGEEVRYYGNTYHLRQNMDAYFFSYFPELKPSPKGDTTHGPKTEQPRKQVEGQVRQPVRQPDRLDRGR